MGVHLSLHIFHFNRKTCLRGEQGLVLNTAARVTMLFQLTFRVGKLTLNFELDAEVMGHR